MLFQPGGDDYAVAERLEAVAVLGAGRPGDDLPGMNAEAQAKALAVLRLRAARFAQGALRDLLRREASLRGVVRPGHARREQGEDSVAHVLHDHAVVRLHRRCCRRIVSVHHRPEGVLAEALRQRRRADHVGEHDRGVLDVARGGGQSPGASGAPVRTDAAPASRPDPARDSEACRERR